jgi:hypothetical protein
MTEPLRRPSADGELWALVDAFLDSTATVAERDRLDARLRDEPQARSFYVAYLDLHAQLQWRTRGGSARPAHPRGRWRGWLAAAVALAAGLLVAVSTLRRAPYEESPELPEAPAGSVAVLIDNQNATWDQDMALPTRTGSALPPGRLKLKAGVVEVAFRDGGDVLLEGPADFDIRGADRAFLRQGKLTAKVPEGAPVFQVSMPGVVVSDFGGECGLMRDDAGVAEVHVFGGQVGADPTDGQGVLRLAQKTGSRVDLTRQTMTPVPFNEQAFEHLRPEVRVADVSVRGGQFAGRNFGTAARLVVKNSIPDYCWEAYLTFDLAGVKGQVGEAWVRLMPVRVGQPLVNAAALVRDGLWGEASITWATKPASDVPFATWTAQEGQPVDLDVTQLVREALSGDNRLSLRIFAPEWRRGKSYVEYGSRRGDAESRPRLFITTLP